MDYLTGRMIRQARKAKGLTQKELADQIGLSLSPIHYLEMGSGSVSIGNAVLILDAIDLQLTIEPKNAEKDLPPKVDNKKTSGPPHKDNKKMPSRKKAS